MYPRTCSYASWSNRPGLEKDGSSACMSTSWVRQCLSWGQHEATDHNSGLFWLKWWNPHKLGSSGIYSEWSEWPLQICSISIPTLLKMEFEEGESYWNFILKFHFCNPCFLNDFVPPSIGVGIDFFVGFDFLTTQLRYFESPHYLVARHGSSAHGEEFDGWMMDVFPPWMDWHGSQGSQWHPWRWDSGMATRKLCERIISGAARFAGNGGHGPWVHGWVAGADQCQVGKWPMAKCRLMGTKYLQQELVKLQYWYDVV